MNKQLHIWTRRTLRIAEGVAQISNLLCRGFPIRQPRAVRTLCRLQVGDTAHWKTALQTRGVGALAASGWLVLVMLGAPLWAAPAVNRVENLTLDQALEIAESLQPQLAEAKAMVEAAEGRARQAGAFPNPEAILGAQQLPFSGNAPNEKEYVAGVGQTIPLSQRLSKARQAELLDREVRARGLEVKRRDIHWRVRSAFATALYQEKAYQAQTEIQQSTGKAVATTQARVEAGDALREDLARVEMELARAKVELQRAESLREQSLVALASAMGDASLKVTSLAGTLEATFEIPTLETLAANLAALPETALADADLRARNARVAVAEAERIPDVKVELLYHRLESSQQNTMDVGLSIPLPLFNRNQGRLREARAEAAAAEARSRMTQNELSTRLRESYLQLTTALANSRTLKTEILSRADTVLKGAEARYAAGDISLAEILPVRRDWAAVQLSYLESLRDVMQAWAEVAGYLKSP
jgi:cobalt-zinc-cadmium efflux system outer membrane protein